MGRRSLTTFAVLAMVSFGQGRPALAAAGPDKQACVDAATRGQIQRDDLKLGAAAGAFELCAAESCPAAVRRSCRDWLADAKSRIPYLTVHLADDSVQAASLHVDGAAASFDAALSLDPGRHTIRVEADRKAPLSIDVVLSEREAKTIDARFPVDRAPSPAPVTTRPTPLSAKIALGVAGLAVASWATFALLAQSKTDRLKDDCAPACSTEDRDAAFRLAAVADVSLGIAVVAAATAVVLYLTRPARPGAAALALPAMAF
jgi:hypothetical protein